MDNIRDLHARPSTADERHPGKIVHGQVSVSTQLHSIAYIDAYTPGIWALATLASRLSIQHSSLHTLASEPQMRVISFAFKTDILIIILFFKRM